MSIFEHYTANIPMFFPTKRYAKELFNQNQIFSDLTFYKIQNKPEPDDMNNPNSLRNPSIFDKWLDTCDFYDTENMKYLQYFDSPSHLTHMLKNTNTQMISSMMASHNALRKQSVYNSWSEILNSIERSK
jgi:hypothetical protein